MLLKYKIQKIVLIICTILIIPIMFIPISIFTSFIGLKFSILNFLLFLALIYRVYNENIENNKIANDCLGECDEFFLDKSTYQDIYNVCKTRNISFPKLLLNYSNNIIGYTRDYTTKNGEKQHCIVISSGLIKLINNSDELKAVILHELAHIYKKDLLYIKLIKFIMFIIPILFLFAKFKDETFYSIIIVMFVMAISILVHFFLFSLFQKVIEYEADLIAGMYLGATPVITLLEKLEIKTIPMTEVKFSKERFFPSHPTLKNRIKKLKQI